MERATDSGGSGPPGHPGGAEPSRADLYAAIQYGGQRMAAGLIRLLHAMSARTDLNPTDFQTYALLNVGGPMTPGEIAQGLRLATGSVTVVVDRLEQRGLVERRRHPADRRKVVVHLRTPPEAMVRGGSLGIRDAMVDLHDGYSTAELAVISDWLQRVGVVLADLAAGDPPPD
ncbi:MarR family winged helix-turn-helix transcriptional regulator [Nocardiopsis trehalosi]|uniref:MarR family winged helix-turn-helix transcriptional regulator n=1 Tax=Nocardiopsis trehalosi TaxID=109329 RepID=UPI00082F7912|nr:MarR family transcriptional regulator [Nocardiopsis trehalosi]